MVNDNVGPVWWNWKTTVANPRFLGPTASSKTQLGGLVLEERAPGAAGAGETDLVPLQMKGGHHCGGYQMPEGIPFH